jgi:hypothetical protein
MPKKTKTKVRKDQREQQTSSLPLTESSISASPRPERTDSIVRVTTTTSGENIWTDLFKISSLIAAIGTFLLAAATFYVTKEAQRVESLRGFTDVYARFKAADEGLWLEVETSFQRETDSLSKSATPPALETSKSPGGFWLNETANAQNPVYRIGQGVLHPDFRKTYLRKKINETRPRDFFLLWQGCYPGFDLDAPTSIISNASTLRFLNSTRELASWLFAFDDAIVQPFHRAGYYRALLCAGSDYLTTEFRSAQKEALSIKAHSFPSLLRGNIGKNGLAFNSATQLMEVDEASLLATQVDLFEAQDKAGRQQKIKNYSESHGGDVLLRTVHLAQLLAVQCYVPQLETCEAIGEELNELLKSQRDSSGFPKTPEVMFGVSNKVSGSTGYARFIHMYFEAKRRISPSWTFRACTKMPPPYRLISKEGIPIENSIWIKPTDLADMKKHEETIENERRCGIYPNEYKVE